jgi:hypothetical protein
VRLRFFCVFFFFKEKKIAKKRYYFKNEADMNPAGSIRLDLVEVTFYREGDRVGFTLAGGRKHNPRTFVTESQPECDRWVAEIRSIKVRKKRLFLWLNLVRPPMKNASVCKEC